MRAESTTEGNGPYMTYDCGKYVTCPACFTVFLNSTEETDRKLLDWNHCVN